ncbi:MAG: thiamine phosphate synthase [Bacteroidaceae bacterium]|nr:thiamine phosphate synthase [Bacteroidaceae bacterium]
MRIAVATSPLFFVEENAIIQALFEEGLDILHLSKPDSEPIYCERLLTLMPQRWYSRIVTSDHFYLQGEYGLKGIHLSQRNPEMPRGYRGYVSRSCSTEDLGKYSEQYGHLVLEATPSAIEQAVRERKINHRVFMRGITTIDGVQFARDCGFGGIVLENVLWERFDAHESNNFKELVDLFKIFRKAAD